MSDYVPIPCAFHERLEFAVLKRQRLRLRYSNEGEELEAVVLPTDVATRDGAEWLICRTEGDQSLTLRLDCLRDAQPI